MGHQKGVALSEETKQKMRASMTPERKAYYRALRLGKKCTAEEKANMSASWSPERRKRQAERMVGRVGKACYGWRGGKTTDGKGYVRVLVHNGLDQDGRPLRGEYLMEHRVVMEKILGRALEPCEHVHHKNQIKSDNRPENLEILIAAGPHNGTVRCPFCQKRFLVR